MNEVPTEVEEVLFKTDDFAEALIKKRRLEMSQKTVKSSFINTKFILPTSNRVERFFSGAACSINDLRQSLLPQNLEMQLLLKLNESF